MSGILAALIEAFFILFSWPTILYAIAGTLIGVIFGVIPGLGGLILLALLIPFTYGMDPGNAMVLFGSALGGGVFSGSITAILVNVPGTATNMATLLDGHPMTKEGRASEAIGLSATASASGALVGLGILLLLIPVAREIILAFGSSEMFWLTITGLVVVGVTAPGSMTKALIGGGFGLMLAFIGLSPISGTIRYDFGIAYLWNGIDLVVIIIGLFAIAEVLNLSRKGGSIAKTDIPESESSALTGVKRVYFERPWLFIRSSVLGTVIGIVPGVGGLVPPFISYMQAKQTSSEPERFGQGHPDGVIASEAANDAKDGGALLPTVVFGIPGSATMAILLGAFTLHGLTPGTELLNDELDILMLIILSLAFSNVFSSLLGLSSAKQLGRITQIDVNILIPPIIVVSLVGAFAINMDFMDVVAAILFGLIGYAMITLNYSRIGLVLGLVLGPIAETSFHQVYEISGGNLFSYWMTRPISLGLILIIAISAAYPIIQTVRNR